MSPQTFSAAALRTVPLLDAAETVRGALATLLKAGVPALPVVEGDGRLRGIFGEREFMRAVFPGYLDTLGYAGFVPRSLDRALERQVACGERAVGDFANTEHIDVGPNASDAQIAETFLHHRVLVVPVVDGGRVTGIVTRTDFFRAVGERFLELGD